MRWTVPSSVSWTVEGTVRDTIGDTEQGVGVLRRDGGLFGLDPVVKGFGEKSS